MGKWIVKSSETVELVSEVVVEAPTEEDAMRLFEAGGCSEYEVLEYNPQKPIVLSFEEYVAEEEE